jgi:hemoglobin-like flavoprotein
MSNIRLAEHGGYIFIVQVALSPHQMELIYGCFPALARHAQELSDMFYSRLFAEHPQLRALFPEDLAAQKGKLIQMLAFVVKNLRNITEVFPEIAELGRRHRSYDVHAKHYVYVGDALIWALERTLRPEFTDELRDAWLAVYRMIAQTMQELGAAPRDTQHFYSGVIKSILDGQYGVSDHLTARLPEGPIEPSHDNVDPRKGRIGRFT